jgi:hypothetical protein
MGWVRRGCIFNVKGNHSWNISHAQVPTALILPGDIIRIFYSSRDIHNRSIISFFDVSAHDPHTVIYIHDSPICDLGALGAFDDAGMMPSSIVADGDRLLLYYTGWSRRIGTPYHNSIGVLSLSDNGFGSRIGGGPVLSSTLHEPFFVATAEVKMRSGQFYAWYAACVGWEQSGDSYDPSYHIKAATSDDGLHWVRDGSVAVDFSDQEEVGIARASVIFGAELDEMWFCYRRRGDFRRDSRVGYKIGYSSRHMGSEWSRDDNSGGLLPAKGGWDSEMVCYPCVVEFEGRRFMFYNGNGFGSTGIGFCEWI